MPRGSCPAWRLVHKRGLVMTARQCRKVGHGYLDVAVDDHSRLVSVEAYENEKAGTCVCFLMSCPMKC